MSAAFRKKTIKPYHNVGQILRSSRENLGLSLNNLSKQLKINEDFLQCIEDGNFNKLPGEFYIRTFVKQYAQALGVRFGKIEEGLEKEIALFKKWSDKKQSGMVQRQEMLVFPKIIRKGIISVVLLLVVGYLVIQVGRITAPPTLEVFSPSENSQILTSATFFVSGQTDVEASVIINSREVTPDETGYFDLMLDLSEGVNIIRVEAKTRYSRKAEIERQVVLQINEN